MTEPQTQAAQKASEAAGEFAGALNGWSLMGFRTLQSWQLEMASFVGRRLEHDRATWGRLAQCRDVGDVARVQQEWATQTADAYLQESRRLAEIALSGRPPV